MKILRSLAFGVCSAVVCANGFADPLPATPKAPSKNLQLAQNARPSHPRPGIYEAAPCMGMVLVPAEIDPRFVIGKSGPDYSMPMFKPDLRLIPRERKGSQ